MRFDVLCDDTAGAHYSAFADSQNLSLRRDYQHMRPDIGILFKNNPARASCVRKDCGSDAYLHTIVNLNSFRVFVFQVNFVPNEDIFADLDSSQSVNKWPKAGRSGCKPSQQV